MPRRVSQAEAVREVTRLAERQSTETLWIGIDGRGGAGKSTFAGRVAAALARAVVVHVDDFSGPRHTTWDRERFATQVLAALRHGRPARYQRWDWDRDEGAEWHDIAVASVVLVEGVSSTRSDLDVPWALTVWVEAPRDIRLERARARDGAALMGRWLDDWMPSEERYIAAEHPELRADLVVSGTEPR